VLLRNIISRTVDSIAALENKHVCLHVFMKTKVEKVQRIVYDRTGVFRSEITPKRLM
jgi:hypothetical protein